MKPYEFDLQYEEARREARKLLGKDADIQRDAPSAAPSLFSHRVGINSGGRFVIVGAGDSFRAALADAKSRQK